MKNSMSRISQHARQCYTLLLAVPFLVLASGFLAGAASSFTNWEGLAFGLVVSKTNLTAGEKIPASIVVSNTLDTERMISGVWGDPCMAGIGEFLIFEERSGKRMDCAVPLDERVHLSGRLPLLYKHGNLGDNLECEAELVRGYALTNAGVYSVQAVGKFRLLGSPDKYCTATTPPIVISLSPKAETNAVVTPEPAIISSTNHSLVR